MKINYTNLMNELKAMRSRIFRIFDNMKIVDFSNEHKEHI